jgi:hypothetical protein
MQSFSEGYEFETSAGMFIIKDGVPVPAVKRGPLGGELKRLIDCKGDEGLVFLAADPSYFVRIGLGLETLVETNIPPRLTGEKMTAGEAAKVPGIVGRWVALPVLGVENSNQPINLPGHNYLYASNELILLPEGFVE